MNQNTKHIIESENSPIFYLNFNATEYLGIGIKTELKVYTKSDFNKIDSFIKSNKGAFIFCSLSYDLKTIIQELPSENKNYQKFPLAHFVVAEKLTKTNFEKTAKSSAKKKFLDFHFMNRSNYLKSLAHIKNHLQIGDIYETNFCVNPSIRKKINPLHTYQNLQSISQAPFSGFYKFENQYLMCASPERFLQKKGLKLISQPIKGTIRRGQTIEEDEILKQQLKNTPKEISENIMIVDLVRNDLSKVAKRKSVRVDALNQIQSFNAVHQLVSTVSCEIEEEVSFTDIIRALFPMGSMTGAPKIRAMQLMEQYEDFRRGMYSGSIGFIDEKGDFDLNVVIRSILYNAEEELVQFPVGGAITYKSDPELEYEECLLKAQSMIQALSNGN